MDSIIGLKTHGCNMAARHRLTGYCHMATQNGVKFIRTNRHGETDPEGDLIFINGKFYDIYRHEKEISKIVKGETLDAYL
jgi:hypothetical protein